MRRTIRESGQAYESPIDLAKLLMYFAFDPLDAIGLCTIVFNKLKEKS